MSHGTFLDEKGSDRKRVTKAGIDQLYCHKQFNVHASSEQSDEE